MKTKTYKSILLVVAVLQLVSAGSLLFGQQMSSSSNALAEQLAINQVQSGLLRSAVVMSDYMAQLSGASGEGAEGAQEYEKENAKMVAKLDELEKMAQANPRRLELYQEQRKLLLARDKVVAAMRETLEQRAGGNRMGVMIVILAGMRKINAIADKLTANFDELNAMATTSSSGLPMPTIIAMIGSVLSLALAIFLLTRTPEPA